MPIYEFRCVDCGHVTEVIQAYSAPAPEHCEIAMVRQISRTNWQFGEGPTKNHSEISKAIGRVKRAEREGRA